MQTKVCSKCHKEKFISEFHKAKDGKFGVTKTCKDCMKLIVSDYYIKNKEEITKKHKLYHEKNRDSILNKQKEWREENHDKLLDSQKKYREQNREKCLNINRQYYLEHRDEILQKHKLSYGIKLEDYTKMLEAQNNVCAICGNPEISNNRSGKIKDLSIDHNHKTGKVRGLLCHNCNSVLGYCKDNINVLELAIKYLKKDV